MLAIIENRLEEIKTRWVRSVKFFIVVQVRGEDTLEEREVNEFSGSQNVKLREIDDIQNIGGRERSVIDDLCNWIDGNAVEQGRQRQIRIKFKNDHK